MDYMVNAQDALLNRNVRRVIKEKLSGALTLQAVDTNCLSGMVVDYCFDKEGDLIIRLDKYLCRQHDLSDQSYLLALDQENDLNADILISGVVQAHYDQSYCADIFNLFFHDVHISEYNAFDYFYLKLEINHIQLIDQEGNIFHIERNNFIQEQIFSLEQINATCDYVNQYHQEALRQYCQAIGLAFNGQIIRVIAFDKEGIWLYVNNQKYFMSFSKTISNLAMFRAILIALAKQYGLLQHHQES